jgi:hypothetical protein
MSQLWKDEAGFVVSADLVLVSSILVLGMMVGLVSIRDQIVMELADVGYAFALLNQSYTWSGVTGHTSNTSGSALFDATDFCDDVPPDEIFPESLCISVTVEAPEMGEDAG